MTLLTLPSAREEAWRWSDLSPLPDLSARAPTGRVPADLPWINTTHEGSRLLFVDGRLDKDRSRLDGVTVGDVDVASNDHPLARLAGRSGWALRLRRDHATSGPVQIVHVSTGAADHLTAEIALDVDAQASVVETFIGEGWANRVTGMRLAKGARLMLNRRLLGASGFVSLADRAEIGEGASLVAVTFALGGADSRLDGRFVMTGEGAYAEAAGALLTRRRERHDANLVIRHEVPGGVSRQVWRSVAGDKGACSVAARVEVARDAQKTDAEQSLRGLLLDRGATINAKPELEIFADDVKCAHGAAVGELDEQALFYLESRGVMPGEAKALLTRAFVADAIERVGEEEIKAALYADAESWFAKAPEGLDGAS